jgi:tetratricopeptide (TPR) repeat protein
VALTAIDGGSDDQALMTQLFADATTSLEITSDWVGPVAPVPPEAIDPAGSAELLELADALWDADDPAGSVSLTSAAIVAWPENPAALHALGQRAELLQQGDAAIAAYLTAVTVDPAFLPARRRVAALRISAGDFAGAVQTLLDGLEADPGNGELHALLAIRYGVDRDCALAVQHRDQALELGAELPPQFLELVESWCP